MRGITAFFLIFFVSVNSANFAPISIKKLVQHVTFLSSEALEGRLTGSIGEFQAIQYIANLFSQLELNYAGDKTYYQVFKFKDLNTNHIIQARNVIARLKVGEHNKKMILIGAHIDHLGKNPKMGSRANAKKSSCIHPGADDNASGVAVLLETAYQLKALQKSGNLHGDKDILFAIWSGEELGVLGSSHFINILKDEKPFEFKNLQAVINLDMVGHLRDYLLIQGVGSSLNWPNIIEKANVNQKIAIRLQSDPYLPTDTTPFYLEKIPTLNFFTGIHPFYHTPKDTAETLNYNGMQKITAFLINLIQNLENQKTITYNEVPKKFSSNQTPLNIYLGTLPNYANSINNGVKLQGVIKDSPAYKAGLKKEDVIVMVNNLKIDNIYDYTLALSRLKADHQTKVLIYRNNKKITLHIIPAKRI